jgi:ATP-dependent DNA ligase
METGILDAEIVVLKKGKSVFYNGVDQRRTNPTASKLKDYPVSVIVFDAIQIGSEVLVNKPYKDRLALLQNQEWTSKIILIDSTNHGEALWEQVIRDDEEGLVAKDPLAPYEIGVRSKRNIKFKNYKYFDVPVERIEPNPKGTKIFANVIINGAPVEVNCHQAGCFSINVGDVVRVKYLDIVDGKMIQATRF